MNIKPTPGNYETFVKGVKKTARRHIPRGCRVEYIPGLSKETATIYEEYVTMFESDPFAEETISTGEKMMESISQERQKTWNSRLESTDMSKNSKKAWPLIRKLRSDPKAAPQQPTVTANQVAHQLLLNGKSGKGQKKTKLDRSKNNEDPGYTIPFTMDERHPMFNQPPVQNRLKSRKSFLKCVNPLEPDTTTSEARLTTWEEINNSLPSSTTMEIVASEQLPPGADESWAKWKCLNRLRTGVGRAKVTLSKWGYRPSNDTMCDCGTMEHLLRCPLLQEPCTSADLATYNDNAEKCVQHWLNKI